MPNIRWRHYAEYLVAPLCRIRNGSIAPNIHSDDMALLFEAIREFSEEEKDTVRTVLAGLVLQHSARRCDSTCNTGAPGKPATARRSETHADK